MTTNQVAYWNMRLNAANNYAANKEQARHNLAAEQEIARSNLANEQLKSEQNRISWGSLSELGRHNQVTESQGWRNLRLSETSVHNQGSYWANMADVAARQAAVAEKNIATMERNAATNERNAQTLEWQAKQQAGVNKANTILTGIFGGVKAVDTIRGWFQPGKKIIEGFRASR